MPIGVKENGNPLREAAYEMGASNTDNLQNKYYNVSLGFTVNITKNWDVKFDYTYDRQTTDKNSSIMEYNAGQTWYSPVPWIENGSQVYVNRWVKLSIRVECRLIVFRCRNIIPTIQSVLFKIITELKTTILLMLIPLINFNWVKNICIILNLCSRYE